MKTINNERGYTLAELVAVLPLGLLIMAALTLGTVQFIKNYQEIRLYSRLQQEVMQTIETIRFGYVENPYTKNQILIGLATANKVELETHAQGYSTVLTIKPVDLTTSNGETSNYSTYYLDMNNELMVRSNYGGRSFTRRVFPIDNRKIGRFHQFEIVNKDIFTNVTPSDQTQIYIVKIHIKARVRFRDKGRNQTNKEDLRVNTKIVDFETNVYASNVKQEGE